MRYIHVTGPHDGLSTHDKIRPGYASRNSALNYPHTIGVQVVAPKGTGYDKVLLRLFQAYPTHREEDRT